MFQKTQQKEESIKQLKNHLKHLTNELSKTSEHIQILELQDESKSNKIYHDSTIAQEISQLLQKQNSISHEIMILKKRIQKLSAKTILKTELIILPIVIVLLFFMIENYVIQPTNVYHMMKTRYNIENLRDDSTISYSHWNLKNHTPLVVSIESNEKTNEHNVQAIKNAIMSTDSIIQDYSILHNSESTVGKFFKGWQGAIQTTINTKYIIPEKFDITQSSNGESQIVITLSAISDEHGYSSVTRSITNGNQILKTFITIYDSNKLTDNQIETLVRHEFGHALGLPWVSNNADLMYDTITSDNSYISECDIHALENVYNDINPSNDFCT